MIVDDSLFAMIIAGIGFAVTDPKAASVFRRIIKAAARSDDLCLRELHANRLQPRQIDVPVAALRNHQPFLSKESALCGPGEWLFTVYSRKSREPRDCATQGAGMTSKSKGHFPLSGAYRLLAALFAVGALTGCHGGFIGDGCLLCGPSAPPDQANLKGTLSGLVGSELTLQNNGSQTFFDGPASNGSAVVFGVVNFNTTYNLTVQTQPTNPSQTCVVANGTGTAGTADVTNITVTCTTNPPRFAYVANRGSNNVSAYSVDATTGALTAIAGSPISAGNVPVAIAVDPTGSYAYVANQMDATISAFTINRTSGMLSAVNGSPFATGSAPSSVAVDSVSATLYVTNSGANSVSAYAITPVSGVLTPITGSPFTTGTSPAAVTVNPLGFGVYVANQADGTVSEFSTNAGALTPATGSPFAVGMDPRALSSDPSGQYLYIANGTSNTLSAFSGSSAVTGSPYATGSTPISVAVDPLDNYVYVANQGSNNISAFALNAATGALTVVSGSPFVAGTQPSSVAVDPTGMFAYVVNAGADSVSVYAIKATNGALTPIAGSPFVTGTQPTAIAISD
jgi:6-phosphogluconolactonase